MKYAAVSLNFDSLNEAYGFPPDYVDVCFTKVMDRFFAISEKYNFKYSIYIIGKDLEKPSHFDAVRKWSRLGHEIGNHTQSHCMNLGALPKEKIRFELEESHKRIEACTGKPPTGFIAPAWSSSQQLWDELVELGYQYDTSTFPSWLLWPIVGRIALNHLGDSRFFKVINRRDLLWRKRKSKYPFVYRSENRDQGSLSILPLPTGRFGMPVWHTIGFIFGWDYHFKLLRGSLDRHPFFYYVVHPADLLSSEDLDPNHKHHLERTHISLEEKIRRFEESIATIAEGGRQLVTMERLSKAALP